MPPFARLLSHVPALLLWAGMLSCLAGLGIYRLWTELPFPRFFELVLMALLALAGAWPLRRWRRASWASAITLVWLAGLVVFAGPLPVLAVALLAAAAVALGSLLAPGLAAMPIGLAMIAGILGWLLPLPMHYRSAYLLGCVALVGWRHAAVTDAWRSARAVFNDTTQASPRTAAAALLLLGLASTGAWLPTMQYDDVVYHLGLPSQLQYSGRYALDPIQQVWALSPWGADVLQGVAQVLAGGEARGALNALWLCIAAAGVHALVARIGGDVQRRWWSVALLASLPLTMQLAAGMQTELPAMAYLPALALIVLREPSAGGLPRGLLAGAVLFGALCGLKTMHAVVALPLLAWAGWRHRVHAPWRWLPAAVLAAFAVGASSYIYAWSIAGNPVLPLLNGWFHSPFFAATDFNDPRWHGGLDADVLWDISFDSEHYFEAFDGGFGFVLVALAGAWLLALRDCRTRGLACVASLGLLLPLLPLQYARYMQPALVLLLPALVVAYPVMRFGVVAFWSLCALNLAFAANAGWMLRTGALKQVIRDLGRDTRTLQRFGPERVLAARLRATDGDGVVLVMPETRLALAEMGPQGRNMLWYSPAWHTEGLRVAADASGHAWARLLADNRIRHVILHGATVTPAQRAGLQQVGGVQVDAVGDAQWWRIPDNAAP